jgi:outer membrane receptor protein involved in Fe transport
MHMNRFIRVLALASVFSLSCVPFLAIAEEAPDTTQNPPNVPEETAPQTAPGTSEETAPQKATNAPEEAAPQQAPGGPITTMNPVVISATRTERTVSDLPVSSTVLGKEKIKETPALVTDDLLRQVPSINLPNGLPTFMSHPTASSVSIRGLGGQRVLFLMDGIPINDPFFGYVDFNRIPKNQIDRIEVVRGGSSSLWGSFAEGGIVNLITRPIDSSELQLSTLGGTYSTFREDLHASQRVDEHLGISLDVNYFSTAGFDPVPAEQRGAIDRPTSSHSANVQLKAEYHTAGFEGFVRGGYFENHQILDTHLSTNATNTVNLASGARWILDAQNDIKANLFYLNQNFTTNNTDLVVPGSRAAEFLSNLHQTPATDIGGSVQWARTSDGVMKLLSAGMDVRHIEGVDRSQLIAAPGNTPTVLNGGGSQLSIGWFGEASIQPTTNLEILPSVRLDYFLNYNGTQETIPGTTTHPPDKHYVQFDPKLAGRYQIIQDVAIRASIYRGFRAPTLDNLYREYSAVGFAILPNAQLNPEVLWGGEAGFDLSHGPFRGQVNYFYNRVSNQIGTITTSFFPVFTLQQTNIGETRTQGVEAIGEVQLTKTVYLDASYSYTDSKIRSNPSDPTIVGNRTPAIPLHSGSVGARYQNKSGAYLEIRGRYVSSQWDDTGNTLYIPPYAVMDASAACPIWKHVQAFVIAQNILDRQYLAYRFGGDHLGAPFQIFGGLTLTFGGVHG